MRFHFESFNEIVYVQLSCAIEDACHSRTRFALAIVMLQRYKELKHGVFDLVISKEWNI